MKRIALPLFVLFAASPVVLAAQQPENLQVLPRDIPRDSLVQLMRSISSSLGVRCAYCHVEAPGADGREGFDFASDDKRTKRTARFMLRMVRELNTRTLAELADRRDPPVPVGCITCHRGMPVPTTIEGVLMQAVDSAGAPAAIARYRQLREENLERGRFDFSEGPLSEVARRVAAQGKTADAVALLGLNAELHPGSAAVEVQLGDLYRAGGDRARAAEHYRRALEKQPDHAPARRRLEELERPAAP